MSAARGSKHVLRMIKEVTYGTTPATPTMFEIPFNTFNKDVAVGMIRSGQIRAHPFVDRLIKGPETNDLTLNTELQDDTHDLLLEGLCGAAFASNVVKVTDALVGSTFESEHLAPHLFDTFTGACINRGEFVFSAQPDSVIQANYGLMCQAGQLDQTATIATASTAPPDSDPFVFTEATVTIGGSARPVTALTFTLQRTINPLWVLGSVIPREYVPSDVTLTGQITIPLEDATESARLKGFTAAALVAACTKGADSRTFTMPKINYAKMGRQIQNRGVILQAIDFEAKFDSASNTVMSIGRSA